MNTEVNTEVNAEEADYRVAAATGELDLATAPDFGAALRGTGTGDIAGPRLIVDLSGVTFMDCVPLRELCAVSMRGDELGGWTRLVYTHASIGLLLRATRLTQRFPRYATVPDARSERVATTGV
ncbi:STAS domain-containing protein [Streptomyces sp. H10-C2]|uniref:STAS domain-containing protein n=1 Tax=unclassified Streptomyces TaxID=2593676 RepID=UPI0024BBEAC8|nr:MULTISPECIES: STAS domain-containing protein [unclassified Streptomyces]MDJ0342313.1 STAS domain-containing protein [Streptomyces sp. PH10-H1]MDJ0372168.1 STAS domain-containing protein [Streptomyces sp. H10-C2]